MRTLGVPSMPMPQSGISVRSIRQYLRKKRHSTKSAPIFPSPLLQVSWMSSSPLSLPPPISSSHSAPPVVDKLWAIYAIVLEKPGRPPKLYVGSGTNAQYGVRARMADYTRGNFPWHIGSCIKAGYTITHRGMFCWAALPTAVQVPTARLRFLALEAAITFLFHAADETPLDALWTVHIPWKRETVSWLPLCSHTALLERPQGFFDMTDEQLEAYNTARVKRTKEKMAVASKRAEDRALERP